LENQFVVGKTEFCAISSLFGARGLSEMVVHVYFLTDYLRFLLLFMYRQMQEFEKLGRPRVPGRDLKIAICNTDTFSYIHHSLLRLWASPRAPHFKVARFFLLFTVCEQRWHFLNLAPNTPKHVSQH
jgi:hypothetical protein